MISRRLPAPTAAATAVAGIVQIPTGTHLTTVAATKVEITIPDAGNEATIIKALNTTAAFLPRAGLIGVTRSRKFFYAVAQRD